MRGQGYCGADLRALCTEAALRAVRRHYPQIYKTNRRLLLDPSQIEVLPADFAVAHAALVPASRRVMPLAVDRPLPLALLPLVSDRVQEVLANVHRLLGLGGQRLPGGQSGKAGPVGAADRLDEAAEAALALLLADSAAAAAPSADAAGAAGPVARRLHFDALAGDGATGAAPFVPRVARGVFRPRMLVLEDGSPWGTEAIVRAALHACNGVTLVSLEHAVLLADPSRTPEVRRSQPLRACDGACDADPQTGAAGAVARCVVRFPASGGRRGTGGIAPRAVGALFAARRRLDCSGAAVLAEHARRCTERDRDRRAGPLADDAGRGPAVGRAGRCAAYALIGRTRL